MIYKILYPDPILIRRLIGINPHNNADPFDVIRGKILFTTEDEYVFDFEDLESLGIIISYADQTIKYNGVDTYTFRPSNISIKFYPEGDMFRRIYISGPNFKFIDELEDDVEEASIDAFKTFLNNQIQGRGLGNVVANIPRAREGMEARKVWNNRVGLPYTSGPGRNFAAGWPRTVAPNRTASKIRNERTRKNRKKNK